MGLLAKVLFNLWKVISSVWSEKILLMKHNKSAFYMCLAHGTWGGGAAEEAAAFCFLQCSRSWFG